MKKKIITITITITLILVSNLIIAKQPNMKLLGKNKITLAQNVSVDSMLEKTYKIETMIWYNRHSDNAHIEYIDWDLNIKEKDIEMIKGIQQYKAQRILKEFQRQIKKNKEK